MDHRPGQRGGYVSRFVSLPGRATRIELMTGPWVATPASEDSVGGITGPLRRA